MHGCVYTSATERTLCVTSSGGDRYLESVRVVGAGQLHLDGKHGIEVGEHTVRASQFRWGVQQLPRLGEIEGLLLLVCAELLLV